MIEHQRMHGLLQFEKVELKEEDLDVMAPAQFSYHVATLFGGTASYQQLILQAHPPRPATPLTMHTRYRFGETL